MDLRAKKDGAENGDIIYQYPDVPTDTEPLNFAPIGTTGERDDRGRLAVKSFKGTFDGQGHTIENLYQSGWSLRSTI